MSLNSQDPRAAAFVAQLDVTTAAIAAVQPEMAASTTALIAVGVQVQAAIVLVNSLINSLSNSTVGSDAFLLNWASGMRGNLQSYAQTLATLTGQDRANAVTLTNTDLFSVGALFLNDWTRALDIAMVNGLQDPLITQPTKIAIPRN